MELVIPSRSMDFDFHRGEQPSPANLSSPSTPKGFGKFFFSSAPTSPTRMSQFYQEYDEFLINNGSQKTIAQEATKSSTEAAAAARKEDEFAFDFSADSEKASLSADELFDGGKIRPLKPPPKSPRSSMAPGKILSSAFSPRRKKNQKNQERERGRDRTPAALLGSSTGRRSGATRSLSPLRVSELPWEEEEEQNNKHLLIPVSKQPAASTSTLSSSSSKGSGRKWRLRDFLLFRSASEGRATDKDPFRKYSAFRKQEDFKNASFRSGEGSGSLRRRGPVSAHELHYTVNRAVSEDLRKKTFLPYKQGILGRLAFNPAVHALANGFGSLSRS